MSNSTLLEKDQMCLLGLNFNNTKNIQLIKFTTSLKLKNIILSIIFAILTFFKVVCQFAEKCYGR